MKVVMPLALSLAAVVALADGQSLQEEAAAEMQHVVRPGWENGGIWWNVCSERFTYPPAFGFKPVSGAECYRYVVVDDRFATYSFRAKTPNEPLTNIWDQVATGLTSLTCDALDKDGKSIGIVGVRRFWKAAPFRPGAYPSATRSYAEAAKKIYGYLFRLPSTQYWLEHEQPDPAYKLNSYPAKIQSALVCAMLHYAKMEPSVREAATRIAVRAGEYLLRETAKKGEPLEGFPPTYEEHDEYRHYTAIKFAGQTMLLYPATAGNAYLDLFGATGDVKWMAAARAVADRYLALQGEDGTWPLKVFLRDGRPVVPNRCQPIEIALFLQRISGEAKDMRYRDAADRAFAFVERGALKTWNWEGQFEDVDPTAPYQNLSKYPPCNTAMYLISRFPNEPARTRICRELLRFAEDQFVLWERPCRMDGTGIGTSRAKKDPSDWSVQYLRWPKEAFPSVTEQYYWNVPIDASCAELILTYLALYRLEGRELDLAKARAIGDTLTRMQFESGRLPTHFHEQNLRDLQSDWLNCMVFAATALEELARQ